jgi:hypothetical protein
MFRKNLSLFSVVILSLVASSGLARNRPTFQAVFGQYEQPEAQFFVAVSAGAKWLSVQHPAFTTTFIAPAFTLQAGVTLTPRFIIGAEVNGVTRRAQRVPGVNVFELAAASAGCSNCPGRPSGDQFVIATNVTFTNIAGRLDYAFLGNTGPFLAAMGGVSLLEGLPTDVAQAGNVGGVVGARAGYRYRLLEVLEILGEAGWQGQYFGNAQVNSVSVQGLFRVYL